MMLLLFILLLHHSSLSRSLEWKDEEELIIRKISTGTLRGRPIPLGANGDRAFVFAGIPYARAPVGALRFQRPQAPEAWEGIRNATEQGPSCWWNTSFVLPEGHAATPRDEDCLLVNVFASERCLRHGGCAVFQYIYGGQFMFGTARNLDDRTIAENFCAPGRDLVVVTFGYRMNAFGLLNLNFRFPDLNSPNLAIHDIVASLQWTRQEIGAFGGDPRRVTLGGQSSGSVATQILMLCPRANHLFQQIVSMSGPGTIEMLPKNRNQRSSRRLALHFNCVSPGEWRSDQFWADRANVSQVLDCLRALPARVISAALPALERETRFFHGLAKEIAPDGIITDTFGALIRQNTMIRHRVFTGTVSKEWLDSTVVLDPRSGQVDPLRLWLYCRRMVRQLNYAGPDAYHRAMLECVREYGDVRRAPELFDDVNYYVPHALFAWNAVRRGGPATFLYQFEYDRIGNASRPALPRSRTPQHAQDLVYLLGQNRGVFRARDRRLKRLHSALFANFIANGTPGQEARPFDPARANYFRIDFAPGENETKLVGDTDGYHRRALAFWTERMPRLVGPARMLNDETLIDDQMLSAYMDADLARAQQLSEPFVEEEDALWRRLFWTTLALILVLFGLLLALILTCYGCLRRKRAKYDKLPGN